MVNMEQDSEWFTGSDNQVPVHTIQPGTHKATTMASMVVVLGEGC